MTLVHLKINNKVITAEHTDTILTAALKNNIKIPTLCYLKNITQSGACRVCLVEVKKAKTLLSACTTPVSEGMEVYTNSSRVLKARKNSVELILSNHNKNCLSCTRNQNCELQTLCNELGIRENKFEGEHTESTFDDFSYGIIRDTSKCVLCGRCIDTCNKVQGLGILGFENRGFKTIVAPIYNQSFANVNCMQCGQCVNNCPTGALSEKEDIYKVIDALNDPKKHVIVQTAPAVRASLGEEFNLPIGTRVTGKMVSALKECGFERVYDTNFGADLTILEEGNELLNRLNDPSKLPMFTSCCPGWIRYIEYEYPELLGHLSSAKSPHMMLGAMVKSFYAKRKGIDAKDIFVVSIMPCTAKKSEIMREECKTSQYVDVDAVLTTRECGRLIKMMGIDFNALEDSDYDQDLFGEYSGAAVIFGASGGVMEAALRSVKQQLDHTKLEKVDFTVCRGLEGVKEAEIELNGSKIWIAITSSMQAAKPLLDEVKNGTSKYTFIEVMACPGGCINGGGQSYVSSSIKNNPNVEDYKKLRMKVLYDEDLTKEVRVSLDNKQIQDLYQNFLEKPGSEIAEHLLHTSYSKKDKFKIFNK